MYVGIHFDIFKPGSAKLGRMSEYHPALGVQNIRRWSQFCDPTKKNGDDVTGGAEEYSNIENRIVFCSV